MRALSVLAAATMIFVSGCSDTSTPPPPAPAVDDATTPDTTSAPEVDRYENVRGRIAAMPIEGSPTEQDFMIHHESMPNFKNAKGKLGMHSMTMNFPLGEDVSIEDFEIGDAIEFDFEVDWEGSPPFWVTGLRKLPEDTVLDFEKEKPAEVDPHAGHHHGDKPHTPAGG